MGQKARNAGKKKSVPSCGKLANAKSIKHNGESICKTITYEDTELGQTIAEDKWCSHITKQQRRTKACLIQHLEFE